MNKQFDVVVFIGRFQPPHLAHIEIIKQALQQADQLLLMIGSAYQPRTIKNPFTWEERRDMIRASLPNDLWKRVIVCPLRDKMYNDQAWVEQVQKLVDECELLGGNPANRKVGIIGHSKNESSYYLSMFPQWTSIEVSNIDDLNATDIRDVFFGASDDVQFHLTVGSKLPTGIHNWLHAFMLRPEYEQLVNEYAFIKKYKQAWNVAPYAPTFVTVDTVVVQSGHVLLIRRRAEPGKKLFAIPGGFVNQKERLIDAAIRELREETKLKVPDPVLRGSIKGTFIADDPGRSLRGRTITHAFFIELPPGELPKVKGSDDADKAKWVPLNVFSKMEDQMFEDHYHIINHFLGKM